mmetsp:Transcript_37834/g.105248  ORF Transcript_37834/g.105248 Transcript_37834/m.105248 type:complete len:201 (-) Transcript_37834:2385-2987(-)
MRTNYESDPREEPPLLLPEVFQAENADEADRRQQQRVQGQRGHLEDGLEGWQVDHRQADENLGSNSHVEHAVGKPIAAAQEYWLRLRGCCERRCYLAEDQGPIVHGHALVVRKLVLGGVVPVLKLFVPGKEAGDARSHAEEHQPAEGRLQHADVAIAVEKHPPGGQLLQPRVSRRAVHEAGLGGLRRVRDGGPDVRADVD